jgi:hypothetical protein
LLWLAVSGYMTKLTPTRYTYADFIEFNIYSDLKSALRPDDRILLNSSKEYSDVVELLKEVEIPYIAKSKKEVVITADQTCS